MCGIAGFADAGWQGRANGQAQARLESEFALVHRMCDVIRHRGPDDEGIHVEPGVGLGMRRLSIIDLAGGHQPIHNEDRTRLDRLQRRDLQLPRAARRARSSAAIGSTPRATPKSIVHAYEQWGEDAFARLRGMFGLAIWDRPRRTLLLARDRVGIKPLYYAERDGRAVLRIEIKSLLARRRGRAASSTSSALDHYLAFLYTPRDASIFKGVRKLPPGHYLRWHDGRVDVRPLLAGRRHGDVPRKRSRGGRTRCASVLAGRRPLAPGQRRAARRVPLRRRRFVRRRRADGATRRRDRSRRSRSASTSRSSTSSSTRGRSRGTSAPIITSSSSGPTALAILDRLVGALRRAVRRFVGDSDLVRLRDGAPARHRRPVRRRRRRAVRRLRPLPAASRGSRSSIAAAARPARRPPALSWPLLPHGARGKNFLRHVGRDDEGRYLDSIAFFQADEKRGALLGRRASAAAPSMPKRRSPRHFERFARPAAAQPDDAVRLRDLPAGRRADESRPHEHGALDRVARAAARQRGHRLRGDAAVATSRSRNGRRKHILKEALAPLLPAGILDRRKQGFGVPLGVWFRGDLRDSSPTCSMRRGRGSAAISSRRSSRRLVKEHVAGTRDHTLRLWQLLVFELWHRQYLDGNPVGSSAAQQRVVSFTQNR